MTEGDLPAPSTITNILRRHGLLGAGTREGSPEIQRSERPDPNDLWQMDFKGHFATSRSGRCYPLTILDDCSRYSLMLEACRGETRAIVQPLLERAFGRYGLPRQILCDHGNPWGKGLRPDGQPYGTPGLELWLLRLGVELIHGRVRHPQTQGKEERFHRTLKAEVISQKTQWLDHQSCQQGFDDWREIYNHKRPHESLKDEVPASRYRLSARSMPGEIPSAASYEVDGDEIRITRSKGEITFKNRTYYIGQGFVGEPVFLRQESDGSYGVYYCWKRIGRIDPNQDQKAKGRYNSIRI
jgi:transposase InsO family protein